MKYYKKRLTIILASIFIVMTCMMSGCQKKQNEPVPIEESGWADTEENIETTEWSEPVL